MVFRDRTHAAELLAQRLLPLRGTHPLILAIPRGAVPMAAILAHALEGEMDIILVRKISVPGNPEFAIGAVDETGRTVFHEHLPDYGIPDETIERERKAQLRTIRSRREHYTPFRPASAPDGRTVVVLDDGLATGLTMAAALHAVRRHNPARLIAALPVAAPDALARIEKIADETVCLSAPATFLSVSQFYEEFPQVGDEEVIATLRCQETRVTDAE